MNSESSPVSQYSTTSPQPQTSPARVVVLVSGRGSNLKALLASAQHYRVVAVVSNRPDAGGLLVAQHHGIATHALDHTLFESREAFDDALATLLKGLSPDWVVLAGFMRVLTPGFVQQFAGRLINIHPSLLPSFTGLNTHQRALQAGVRWHGATVHFVTPHLDEGPIIDQAALVILPDDTPDSLAARVLALEHQMLPRALNHLCNGALRWQGEQQLVAGALSPTAILDS